MVISITTNLSSPHPSYHSLRGRRCVNLVCRHKTHSQSIAEVFLLCLAGYILSIAGITDKATQRKLNVINVSLFTPALLFSKVRPSTLDFGRDD
jgi:hypothetical protein